jgi:YfiH family protein
MNPPAPFRIFENLSSAAPVRHGFWSRRGGVSEGVYAALNCGPGSGDDPARVAENRARAMAGLGLDAAALRTAYQIHSADVAMVDGSGWPDGPPKVDAMVTRTPGIALGVLTADCGPVLFADPEAGVIGCAHAGWRGAKAGVLEATVAAMETLGASRRAITAVLGPCIAQESYEVGDDFAAAFIADDPGHGAYFAPGRRADKRQFDLTGFILDRLRGSGIGTVGHVAGDTCADEDCFSYRRNCLNGLDDYGRGLSAIALV